jgi:hypothetical protein
MGELKMKRNIIITVLLLAGLLAHAGTIDRMWSSLFTLAPTLTSGEVDGTGIGWWVEVYNFTDDAIATGNTTASLGWSTGFGYVIAGPAPDFNFAFSATETDQVYMRLYNGPTVSGTPYNGESGWYIQSATLTLVDIVDDINPPSPGQTDVTFNFSGQSWQAVPEPATALLFGIGGMGAWMVRRNKLKSKEEADA